MVFILLISKMTRPLNWQLNVESAKAIITYRKNYVKRFFQR